LLTVIPSDYADRFTSTPVAADLKVPKPTEKRRGQANFREYFVSNSKSATVIQPLSDVTNSFLAGYFEPGDSSRDPTQIFWQL